jgi:hypothetical protein
MEGMYSVHFHLGKTGQHAAQPPALRERYQPLKLGSTDHLFSVILHSSVLRFASDSLTPETGHLKPEH